MADRIYNSHSDCTAVLYVYVHTFFFQVREAEMIMIAIAVQHLVGILGGTCFTFLSYTLSTSQCVYGITV